MDIALIIILALLAVLIALYLFAVATKGSKAIKKYKGTRFAHRGLHSDTVAENSMTAFRLAVEKGYGIELDVRLSSDGTLVVFHDDTLDRVTDREGRVDAFTVEELSKIRLLGTEDTVPTFEEVLALVSGRVPLLVEIKEDAGNLKVSTEASRMLSEYKGEYIVESFNPLSLKNVKKLLPEVQRGFLSQRFFEEEKYRKPMYFLLQCLMTNFLCRPSFIAYNHKHYKSFGLLVARKLFRATTFAWTIKSKEEEAAAKAHDLPTHEKKCIMT
jgi:glycerophosphoryl diester phosphodiesterase